MGPAFRLTSPRLAKLILNDSGLRLIKISRAGRGSFTDPLATISPLQVLSPHDGK